MTRITFNPHVVIGKENYPTAAYTGRKRQLKKQSRMRRSEVRSIGRNGDGGGRVFMEKVYRSSK